jgi:hypothetical protein
MDKYEEYAKKIWSKDARKDYIRWYSSGYHIDDNSISKENLYEQASESLDIIPSDIGIDVDIDKWQDEYMDDEKMVDAMAEVLYKNLKKYRKFKFENL